MTKREVMGRYQGSALASCGKTHRVLTALGVFLRDAGQTIGIITTVTPFLSPVFYLVTALPEDFRLWIMANPLSLIIEQAREVLNWVDLPNWMGLVGHTLVATAIVWTGYVWFQRNSKWLRRAPSSKFMRRAHYGLRIARCQRHLQKSPGRTSTAIHGHLLPI